MPNKLKLDITLIAVTGVKHGETIASLQKCMAQVDFPQVRLLTNIDIEVEGIECINVGGLSSVQDYSKFIIKELYKYFDYTHCLIVQYDSWILCPEAWQNDFLNYDIVGAPGLYIDGRQNLNGGFALRSKRFQTKIASDELIEVYHPCDEVLCRLYRTHLVYRYGFKYCPDELAQHFSFELREPVFQTFGFHSFHWGPYNPHVVINRQGAMGDLVMATPVIDYYYEKGYQVVVDTQPELMHMFFNHPYRIKHISEMNKDIVPVKVIDLNMSYESKPKQLVLKTYYEFAGIKDGLLRNSKLYVSQDYSQRLFDKFIVFHIDSTGLPHRNTHGVNWRFVADYYTRLGYTCIQVGKGSHEPVGVYFNAETKELLMYLIKGANLTIAIDSGVAQLSVALEIPSVILSGSVDLRLRYVNFDNIEIIQGECPSAELKNCYHSVIGTTGKDCVFDKEKPSCAIHDEWQIIKSANKLLKLN